MATITMSGPGLAGAKVAADGTTVTITMPDLEDAVVKPPLRIGVHPTPAEYGTWLPKLPTPWFTRVFNPPGKGLPKWGGAAVTGLPSGTIPHISFKDQVTPAAITAFLDSVPLIRPVWLTWYHEGDVNWAGDVDGYAAYWKTLRQVVDGHPSRPNVTLVNVHTQYASRVKRQAFDWRRFVLPDYADVDAWDCYRPANVDAYEDPSTTVGLALSAKSEFGVRTHITEFGTHPTSWDTDGSAQATWYREACGVMAAGGVEAVGFWCNVDGAYEYRPTKAPVLAAWTALLNQYNSAPAAA